MRAAVLLAALVALSAAYGRGLDRIDAEGVTETGGSTNYAHMLTRTGSDGRLAASLLPPAADWASQPIPKVYYVAEHATVQGNGSAQYPFTNLTYALSHMAEQSVLVLAPGTYSGSGTIREGSVITLLGLGNQAYISSLSVVANGASASTMLDLCGLRIGTLTADGGRINMRLAGTTVMSLGGSAGFPTVTRTDMASRIDVSTLTHIDVYTGYPFVPTAGLLLDSSSGRRLLLSGARAVVTYGAVTDTLAYITDITSATGTVYATINTIVATNSALAARISAEESARRAGDAALSNRVTDVEARFVSDFARLGGHWDESFSAMGANISRVADSVTALDSREREDVTALTSSISQVSNAYVAADTALDNALRNKIATDIATLAGSINSTIDTRAGAIVTRELGMATNAAVSRAVSQADNRSITRDEALGLRIDDAVARIVAAQADIATNQNSILALRTADTRLQGRVDNVSNAVHTLSSTVTGLDSRVSSLESWELGIDGWKGSVNSNIGAIKTRINDIINCLVTITNKANITTVNNIPARF